MREVLPAPDFIGTWCLSSINERGELLYKTRINAVVTDHLVHANLDAYVWKAAVEKAKSFDADRCGSQPTRAPGPRW